MTLSFVTQAEVQAAKTGPLAFAKIGNKAVGDNSGYLGLVLNKNANGKAIRIALRDGSQRVHVLVDEVPNMIKALQEIAARGVKTSVSDIEYDAVA